MNNIFHYCHVKANILIINIIRQTVKMDCVLSRNLTILIRPRGGACSETVLPIEVVAIAGRARSPNRFFLARDIQ